MTYTYELSEKKIWHAIISDWPDTATHHLVDMMPEYKDFEWQQVLPVNHISLEKWYSAYSLRDLGVTGDIVMWQEEKLTYEQCLLFRTPIKVVVGCVFNDHISMLVVNLQKFDEYACLFHSTDRIKLKIFAGKLLIPPPMEKFDSLMPMVQEKIVRRIYLQATRPMLSAIQAFHGKGITLWVTETKEVKWEITSVGEMSSPCLDVPEIVKVNWVENWRKPVRSEDYLNPSFYESSMTDYSAWSIPAHQIQMKDVLSVLKGDETLVVPGDGLGLVDSLWAGKLFAGDLNAAIGGRVQKESFVATIVRARRQTQKGVLILSYVTGLMKPEEILVMDQWQGPVIWIDSHEVCPLKGMTLVSRGVCFRGLSSPRVFIQAEMQPIPKRQLYSDNLLRIPRICYMEPKNLSVLYWEMMRPFGPCTLYAPGNLGCLIADSLSDYALFLTKNIPATSFYLSSIGRMAERWIPYLFEEDNVFNGRTIYAMSHRHILASEIMKHTHWALLGEKMLFIFPDKVWSHSFPNGVGTTKISVVPYRVEKPVERYCAKVVSFWSDTIVVNTVCGTMVWRCDTVIIREAIKEYLSHYAPNGWQKTLDSVPIKYPGTFIPGMPKTSGKDLQMGDSALRSLFDSFSSPYRKYMVYLGDHFVKRKTLVPNPFVSPLAWDSRRDDRVERFQKDPACQNDKALAVVWSLNFEKDTRLDGLFTTGLDQSYVNKVPLLNQGLDLSQVTT